MKYSYQAPFPMTQSPFTIDVREVLGLSPSCASACISGEARASTFFFPPSSKRAPEANKLLENEKTATRTFSKEITFVPI